MRETAPTATPAEGSRKVAIVGVELHVPEARTPDAFLDLLIGKREAMREVAVPDGDPAWVARRPVLDGYDEFDPDHFGISARDAVLIDPQHRLFLMACRSLLHGAGMDYRAQPRVGVFASCDENQYDRAVLSDAAPEAVAAYERFVASDKDFLATRVSYLLGLTGPSLSVQTACSSSLVAAHLAAQSLLAGDCDACIAGGVALQVPQGSPYRHVKDMIYSSDGRCRPFDAKADGTNLGSGLGAVLLKRLDDALRDRDRIVAVIGGSAVNNDGRRKMSYTSPSPSGQQDALATALARSGIDAAALRFVEAHGTATRLGDPIEFAALKAAVSRLTDRREFCALTGAKANFGHLSNAAGAVGLIKAALFLERGLVPPLTNFEAPSPLIRLAGSPFKVLGEAEPMPAGPAGALVSSFGIGGTNACMVLERFEPGPDDAPRAGESLVLPLSDDREGALARNLDALRDAVERRPGDVASLSALAFRLRGLGEVRAGLVVRRGAVVGTAPPARAGRSRPRICFVLPGQGTQSRGVLQALHGRDGAFRAAFDRCAAAFARDLPVGMADVLWHGGAEAAALIDDPLYVQPVLFTLQYALVRALAAAGVRPDALVGHSLGEIVALAVADVLSLDEATALIVARARGMAAAPEGLMVMVGGADAERARSLAGPGVHVAALNGPRQVVFAGAVDAVEAFEGALGAAGVRSTRLRNRRPFHTPLMAGSLSGLADLCSSFRPRAGAVPILSTATGAELPRLDPRGLAAHLLAQASGPVLFARALEQAAERGADLFLEIGETFLCHHLAAEGLRAMPLLERGGGDDADRFLTGLLRLWSHGAEPDLDGLRPAGRPATALPGYRFDRRRVWVAAPAAAENARPPAAPAASAARAAVSEADVVDLFRRVLLAPDVGADADFFDIGGHSLLAVSFCQAFKARTGAELSVADLFSQRTPRRIAEHAAH